MANKTLFKSFPGVLLPKANRRNEAGGPAFGFDPKHALTQYAATGCLNDTFYVSATDQLEDVLAVCKRLEPDFIARAAVYARDRGTMKDLPAVLCAVLSVRDAELFTDVFYRVVDSPRMLRNVVQITRSGVVGRKSLGSLPKRLILQWIESRSDEQLFVGSVGRSPSLADIIRMVHPRPTTASRSALFAYLVGRPYDREALPPLVQQYEKFRRNTNPGKVPVPDVPFQMLTSLPLHRKDWEAIAARAPWQTTRMNLNTFLRHGVFENPGLTNMIARRLANPRLIQKARVLPYQLMVAHLCAADELPRIVRDALQDAMEIALKNVPRIDGKVFVFPDVSGSMHSPVTGLRRGSSSAVRCIDVAALVAAAILRKNPDAQIVPFETDVVPPQRLRLNPRDTVMTNARKLAALPAGGTNCSAPLRYLNKRKATADLVVYVSDNESWVDSPTSGWQGGATETMRQWSQLKKRSPEARMVCIDIQPYTSTQAAERRDIVNVGGFSDQVFRLIADVARGGTEPGHWVRQIEQVML